MAQSKNDQLYLGKIFDPKSGKISEDKLLYDPSDLTTHAVVTGMTGSGKTGLCVGLLEEAALKGLPAIIIDPKGDLTNLVLHFPDLLPEDFKPWIDPGEAKRSGKDMDTIAADTASLWKNGLADWEIGKVDIQKLQSSVDFGIYTPGSSSGIPVNIVSSFQAPELSWEENSEVLREDIASVVTGLLGLVGQTDIDPLRSREHILLSNIMENAWSKGTSLQLTDLILQVQKPPFNKLGAFPLDSFFPEKDRFELAMLLNNILASPSFQSWLEGQSLNIPELLYTKDGKPRHSIFYLSHLSDAERMFFVTLLFTAIESWMREQRGTSSLRALVYFDEILGYLPPVANPPSSPVMLRMLKQARAFGVGLLLATQNPVDLNYKALSNTGTWIIGRLQTERDKERLMDGLQSAGGDIDLKTIDKLISGLKKRVFLIHNVHESGGAKLFHTRWAMNYLAGPMTRTQIPALNNLVGAGLDIKPEKAAESADEVSKKPKIKQTAGMVSESASSQKPDIPADLEEYFLPVDVDLAEAAKDAGFEGNIDQKSTGFQYRPALLVQAHVNYYSQKYKVEDERTISSLVVEQEGRILRWDDHSWKSYDPGSLHTKAMPKASFSALPDWLTEITSFNSLQSDYIDWIYKTGQIHIKANETLKLYTSPSTSKADFIKECSDAAREMISTESDQLNTKYEKKMDALMAKIKRQKLEVEEQEDEVDQRRIEELGTHGELVISLLTKRKRSISSSLTKRRMTSQAKAELEQEIQEMETLEKQMIALENEKKEALRDLNDKWANAVNDISEIPLSPYKKDIVVEIFGILWMPHYLLKDKELPAYSK